MLTAFLNGLGAAQHAMPLFTVASAIAACGVAAITIIQSMPSLLEAGAMLAESQGFTEAGSPLRNTGNATQQFLNTPGIGAALSMPAAAFSITADPAAGARRVLIERPSPDLGNLSEDFATAMQNWLLGANIVDLTASGVAQGAVGPVVGSVRGKLRRFPLFPL
ncbi:MAG: hypothetical protein ACKV2U_29320 [Bryobacteraceae bacterium]